VSGGRGNGRSVLLVALAVLAGACVLVGVWARFWGLGRWPLAIDEYYFARSVQNVLHSGLPQFPCGGLYARGLLLQYLSAGLQLAGLSAELAPRLLAALSSLIALWAAFVLAQRVQGRQLALIVLAMLAVSVWEVEMGRFGRMYAPFQALFAWYVVFFVQYTVDGRQRSLAPMWLLSAVGVLVWEGGVFLPLTNLLVPFIRNPSGRLGRREWLYLIASCALVVPAYWLATADLRALGSEPMLPADYPEVPDQVSLSRLDAAVMPLGTLSSHPLWLLAALLPAAGVVFAAIRLLRTRPTPLALLSLLAVLGCTLLQQFGLAAGVLLIALLLSILEWDALRAPASRPFWVSLGVSVVFWVAFALSTRDWHTPGLSLSHTLALLGYEFIRFPDVVREIATPFWRVVPRLSLGLLVVIGIACLQACRRPERTPKMERVLMALLLVLALAASASHPPRHETRYVFFLYPVAIVIAAAGVARAVRALGGPMPAAATTAVTAIVCFGGFMLSEDFRPWHLRNIDTAAVNFRIGMTGYEAAHYHPRSDVRSAAQWLDAHVSRRHDIVIDSYPGIDFYYPDGNYYFVEESDPRFEAWACDRGQVQRWSNLPTIRSVNALAAQVDTGRKVWLVLEKSRLPQLQPAFPPGEWHLEWTSLKRDIVIVLLHQPQKSS